MAKEIVFRCDMTGEPGAEPHKLTLDDRSVSLDLSKPALDKLAKVLAPYFEAGVESVKKPQGESDTQAIRAWAQANGIEVSPKGRISADVVEKYEAAQGTPPAP